MTTTTAINLTANDVQNLCIRYLKDQGHDQVNINIINYTLKPVSEDLAGFFGYHRFLIVKFCTNDPSNKDEKQLQCIRFFTKSAPVEIESRMKYLEEFGVYKKEKSVFSEVLPQLEQIFSGITPKCYYADNTCLIFEDLNLLHYKMAAGRDGLLDYAHLQCSIKTLAAMHAASIAYEAKENKKLAELHPEACEENAYPLNCPRDHMRYQNFNNALKVFKEFIRLMPKYQTNLDEIFEKLQNKMSVIYQLTQTSKKYQNVFTHGDLWANNVMFRYSEDGSTPIQARFVDFQLSRYAPPMLDLITILTIPTSREFRSKYLKDLLWDYYTFMENFLQLQKLSIDDFLTKEQFHLTFTEYQVCGLIESCLFSHLTILPPEYTKSLAGTADGFSDFFERKRVEICLKAFNTDHIYRERLTDILEDLVDNYVLGK